MSSLLQACRVEKSSSHVLTVLLAAEALWMHGITISDKPLWHGPGRDVWAILLIRRQPLMSPSLLPYLSKRGERNLRVL